MEKYHIPDGCRKAAFKPSGLEEDGGERRLLQICGGQISVEAVADASVKTQSALLALTSIQVACYIGIVSCPPAALRVVLLGISEC